MKQIFFNYFLCGASIRENRMAHEGQDPDFANKKGPVESMVSDRREAKGLSEKSEKSEKAEEIKELSKAELEADREEKLRLATALETDGSPENTKQLDILKRLESDQVYLEKHITELEAELPSITDDIAKRTKENEIKIKKEDLVALKKELLEKGPLEMARKLKEASIAPKLASLEKNTVAPKKAVDDAERRKEIDEKLAAYKEKSEDKKQAEKEKLIAPDDQLDISMKISQNNVSAEMLKIGTHEEIVTTMDIFLNKLDLPQNVVEWMGHELDYVNSDEFKQTYPNGNEIFKNPTNDANLAKLKDLRPGFALATEYFLNIKGIVARSSSNRKNYKENAAKSNKEPAFAYTTEKIQEIGRDLSNAFQERDYSKLAMYGVVAYGIYKLYKNAFKDAKEDSMLGKIKKWGPVLAGGYAAGWLLFPDKMKDIIGLGKNVDYKGTSVEGLAELHRQAPKGSLYDRLDPAVLFSLHDARVEDVFGPITPGHSSFNDKFASSDMIPLSTPGVLKYYAPDLVAQGSFGPSMLNEGKNMTVMQKKYINESKKLYTTMIALKEFYKTNVQPTSGVTFEDMFLNPDSKNKNYRPGCTLGSLYDMCQDYLTEQENVIEGSNVKQAQADLKDIPELKIESGRSAGEGMPATIYGYPIVFNKRKSPDGKTNKYVFFLAGSKDPTERVEYTVGESTPSIVADNLKTNIKNRLDTYLSGVAFIDKKNPLKVEYDKEKGEWFINITTKAEHLIESTTGVVKLGFDKKGEIQLTFEGQGITVLTSKNLPSRDLSLLTHMFMTDKAGNARSNFDALRTVSDQITIVENDPANGRFGILLFGKTVPVTSNPKSGKYEMKESDQKALIDNDMFREKYAEARMNSPEYRKTITSIRSIIDQINTMSLATQVKEGAKATASNFWDIVKGDAPAGTLFNGKIPDNYLDMTLAAQSTFLENFLASKMTRAKTFKDLKQVEDEIRNRLTRMKSFEIEMRSFTTKALSPEELKAQVVDKLRAKSYNSWIYTDNVASFERDVISRLKISDVNNDSVSQAAKVWEVYYHYTAKLDSPVLDEQNAPVNPYSKIPKGIKAQAYLKYVREEINGKMGQFLNGSISNLNDWNITSFEKWEAGEADIFALKSAPMMKTEIENRIRTDCHKVVLGYSNTKYESIIQLLYQSYDDPQLEWFGSEAENIPVNITRVQQEGLVIKSVEKFTAECEEMKRKAINTGLQTITGFKGGVQRWVYNQLGIDTN